MRETLDLDPAAASVLAAWVEAVRASPHNLLSRRALDELETRHVPECLGVAALIPAGSHRVLDVGSGGGFPGMVVAIARPDLQVTLLDATSKKVHFLAETAESLGISVDTLDGRSEELVKGRGASFDIVTARAVAPLDRLLGWTLPWLVPGGLLYALKGDQWEAELAAALPILKRVRARVVDVTEPGAVISTPGEELPDGQRPRVVIIQTPG